MLLLLLLLLLLEVPLLLVLLLQPSHRARHIRHRRTSCGVRACFTGVRNKLEASPLGFTQERLRQN